MNIRASGFAVMNARRWLLMERSNTLPWRDLFLLPLIVVATIAVLLGGGEGAARLAWPRRFQVACQIHTPNGDRFRPNCVAWNKAIDGPWVEHRFNDCGYRTAESCKVVPNQLRVVVLGSSASRGNVVPYPQTFAALASKFLTNRCGRKVDFQNLGTRAEDIGDLDSRMPEVLSLRPRAVVLLLNSYDLQHLHDTAPSPSSKAKSFSFSALRGEIQKRSHLFAVIQYYMLEDPASEVKNFVTNIQDDSNNYVLQPLPHRWETRAKEIDGLMQRIAALATPRGVRVILVYVPKRAAVALDMPKYRQPGLSPRALGERLEASAERAGVDFIDATPDFAATPNFDSLFYIVDGHPREGGHRLIAKEITRDLLTMPAFTACAKVGPQVPARDL